MNKYKNKKVVIIGIGKTGISCFNFFKSKKSDIYIMDNNKDIIINNLNILKEKINIGSIKISWIFFSDLIVLSPGVSSNIPEILIAKFYKLNIVNDIEIFCLEKNKLSKIIAITGSNGKSTVSTLVYNIIKNSNKSVGLCGNIGTPVLNFLNKNYDIYIIELSSFQLEFVKNLNSYISVILNISNNHIDRHGSFTEYKNIKHKIYNKSLFKIFNKNDLNTYPLKNNKYNISFSINSGNYHLIKDKNNYFLSKEKKKILNCKYLKINNNHYYINVLAAIAITDLIKIKRESQIYILKKFTGLNHRLKIIKKINKITWINDSKSTNENSTIVAINSIKNYNYIHLILGGDCKLNNFFILSDFIKNKKILLYFFGKDGIKISKFFKNFSIYEKKLENLILKINKLVKANDVILFSPACSSLDQYSSFVERGNKFIKIVNDIYHYKKKY